MHASTLSFCGALVLAACGPEPLPSRIGNIGDSISQGFDANDFPDDHPDLSWIQGTDERVESVYSRYLALVPALSLHPESVTGAEMVAGDDNFAAQVDRLCAQPPLPDSVWILLGGNDVCHRDPSSSADAAESLYSVDTFIAAARAGLARLADCLPPTAWVHVMSVPRVDFVYEVGHEKDVICPDVVWPAAHVCRIVTAEDDAGRRAQIGARINDYNAALAEEVAAFDAGRDERNRRGLRFDSDWHGSIEDGHVNTSVGSIRYRADEINAVDCFHPNIEGQRRLACSAWENLGRGSRQPASCWE